MSQKFLSTSQMQSPASSSYPCPYHASTRGALVLAGSEINNGSPSLSDGAVDYESRLLASHSAQGHNPQHHPSTRHHSPQISTSNAKRPAAPRLRRQRGISDLRRERERDVRVSPLSGRVPHIAAQLGPSGDVQYQEQQTSLTPRACRSHQHGADQIAGFLTDQEFQDHPTTHGPGSPYQVVTTRAPRGMVVAGEGQGEGYQRAESEVSGSEIETYTFFPEDSPRARTRQGDGSRYPIFTTPLTVPRIIISPPPEDVVVTTLPSPAMQTNSRGHDLHFDIPLAYEGFQTGEIADTDSTASLLTASSVSPPVSETTDEASPVNAIVAETGCDRSNRYCLGWDLLFLKSRTAFQGLLVEGFLRDTEGLLVFGSFGDEVMGLMEGLSLE